MIPALTPAAFDYASLPEALAADARAVAQRVRSGHLRTMSTILEMGRELTALKAKLGHGRFGRWLQAEFGAVARTAQNYMLAAERFGQDAELIALLPPSTVYALAAHSTPEPVRAEVVRRLSSGERLQPAQIGALVRAGRDANKPARSPARSPASSATALTVVEPSAGRDQALADLAALLLDGLGNDFPRALELMRQAGLSTAAGEIEGAVSSAGLQCLVA